MQILFCETSLSVRVVAYIKLFLNIIRFTIPILLIIMLSLDFYKNMINPQDKENNFKKSLNRIIAATIVFITPTLINLVMSLISIAVVNINSYQTSFATCYKEASVELANRLQITENEKIDREEEEKINNNLLSYSNQEAKAINNQEKSKNNEEPYSSDLTDTNKQNNVYVQDGVFYIPKYVEGNKSTYSGINCPSNPTSEGYNNPYGYNNHFYDMLQELIKATRDAGYNLALSTQGCRSYQTQVDDFKKYEQGRAAPPGKSKHGFGIASDVTFYINETQTCDNYRNRNNCPGMAFVHDHAKDYGLHFPLLNTSNREDWHIEPINLVTY